MQVILGVIVKPFGLKGEVKVHSNTSFAKKRYKKGNEVILYSPITKKSETIKIASYRENKGMDIISFLNHDSIESIEKYIGYQILIEKPENDLRKNEFYYADLYNCKIIYNDEIIGEVYDMFDSGSQVTLRIKREDKKDLLYPFVDRFIEKVDVENKQIIIKPLTGMID